MTKTFELSGKMTVGNLVRGLIYVGRTTEQILEAVAYAFPAAKTSPACVSWYRSQLRKEGFAI